jgi:hypothetical protein
MMEPATYQRFTLKSRTVRDEVGGISLPNVFYRLDF